MPVKKTRVGLPKKKKATNKSSGWLFKFLDDITYSKTNILNSENDKDYSKYMITKFISVKPSYLPICDILNEYQQHWDNYQFHSFCLEVIPKKKVFFKYGDIKGALLMNQCMSQVETIAEYFVIPKHEAFEYYRICGDSLVNDIKNLYGGTKTF